MFVERNSAYPMFHGNGEQNPRNLRLTESKDGLTLLIEGVFVDDGVRRNKRPRRADVPFKILVSKPLDEWEWQFINSRVCDALERGESTIEKDLAFPMFELVR